MVWHTPQVRSFPLVALLACAAGALAYMIPRESEMDRLGLLREEFCACEKYDYSCRFDVEEKTAQKFGDPAIEILSWENPEEYREIMSRYSDCGAPWKTPRDATAELPVSN